VCGKEQRCYGNKQEIQKQSQYFTSASRISKPDGERLSAPVQLISRRFENTAQGDPGIGMLVAF